MNMKMNILTAKIARDGMTIQKIGSNHQAGSWTLRPYGYEWKIRSCISGNSIKLPIDQFDQWGIVGLPAKAGPLTADDVYKVYQDTATAAIAAASELREAYASVNMFVGDLRFHAASVHQVRESRKAAQVRDADTIPETVSTMIAVTRISERIYSAARYAKNAFDCAVDAARDTGSAMENQLQPNINMCYTHAKSHQRIAEIKACHVEKAAVEILEIIRLEKSKHEKPEGRQMNGDMDISAEGLEV